MEVINISKKKFQSLKFCDEGQEAKLYHIYFKKNYHENPMLFKKLKLDKGISFSNKLLVVSRLIDVKDKIKTDYLVFPESLVTINKEMAGFILPYIASITLEDALKSYSITHEDKIRYLKEIGKALSEVENIRNFQNLKGFHLGDMHERNFIISDKNEIKVIDIDSCKLAESGPVGSRYVMSSDAVKHYPSKYKFSEYGVSIPNEESDLFCYNIMVLNYIAGRDTSTLSLEEFYTYLEYLKKLGFKTELLDIIASIYSSKKNQSPEEYLDTIPQSLGPAKYKVFEYLNKKK